MTRRARLIGLGLALGLASPALGQGLLVVPFELDRFDARVGWLGEGTAVGVTAALQARGVPVVTRASRLEALERLQLPAAATLTRATLLKVADLVGAGRVVVGRVAEHEGLVTLSARVIDVEVAALKDLPAASAPAASLFEAFERVADALAERPATVSGRPPPIAPSVPAFESYVRALVATASDAQERLLKQALSLAPAYADAREGLWHVLTTRGAHAAALTAAGGVRGESVPGGTRLGFRLRAAASLVHLGRHDEAFTMLTRLSESTRDPAVPALLGVVQLRRGATPQTGRATYYFNQAVERDAASADACFNLGYAYWFDKDAMAAAYWLREAVRRNPTDGDAHAVLAAALSASGAAPEAERERELARRLSDRWERLVAGDPVPRGLERLPDPSGGATSRIATALAAGQQRDQQELATFHIDAAQRAYDAGRDPEAIRELLRALYLAPYDVDALRLLGRAQARSGLLQDAANAFKIAIWSAESAGAQVELGEVLLRMRDARGALAAAERALALEPGLPEALDLAARARGAGGPA